MSKKSYKMISRDPLFKKWQKVHYGPPIRTGIVISVEKIDHFHILNIFYPYKHSKNKYFKPIKFFFFKKLVQLGIIR